jgi:hypothetical protein
MSRIEVHLYSQSQPSMIGDARNAYTKDGLYCVWRQQYVDKFPVEHIFRIREWHDTT